MTPNVANPDEYHKVNLVALHITAVCGHRCPFCYMGQVRKRRRRHPPLERLLLVADALSVAGVREVTFVGGDPAMHPDALDLARHCSARGLTVSVLSNSHRYPGASFREVLRYVSALETTIHAPIAADHDAFCRKKGAFHFVLDRLRLAKKAGRRTGIAINVTPLTAGSLFDIACSVTRVHRVPLDYVIVQRIIPFGDAGNTSEFAVTRKHAEQALLGIERIDDELRISISVEDPFPLCIIPARLRKYMKRCEWGFTKASVNDLGDVSRCGADPRYRLGNLLETPLLTIWNTSPVLASFRARRYLPGRCQACADLDQCAGGCPLSCEIEKDHGLDYLFLEYERLDTSIHGQLTFGYAKPEELSSILQIEWSQFAGYRHSFSMSSILEWYGHNPAMFYVLRDVKNWVMAFACMVPVTRHLHEMIRAGKYTTLMHFPKTEVLRTRVTPYYHLEVIATVPARPSSGVGRVLIREVGDVLLRRARYVTTSPITDIGVRLCRYFGFRLLSAGDVAEPSADEKEYPVWGLRIDQKVAKETREKLERF